jgi:MoxR-like ATPase
MAYATTLSDIIKQLAPLPGPALIFAAKGLGSTTATTKAQAIDVLAGAVQQGQITIAQIRATTPVTIATVSSAGQPAFATDPKVEAAARTASRAESAALDAVARLGLMNEHLVRLTGDTQITHNAVEALTREVAALRDTKADPQAVKSAIQSTVEAALGPIIQAAQVNGTVEQVKAAASTPEVRTVAEVFGVALNDIKGNPLRVEYWADPSAPAVDSTYIWQESILRALVISANTGTPVWLGGEKGTGKTQAAMQWAARTGRAFTRINFHKYSSAEEYLGATGLVNGQTEFVPGPFLAAYTHPGAVILLDEPTNADPGELAPLNGALERGTPRVNIGGQVWARANGVMTIAADNTLTNGDASGRYAGTRTMNSALADRFGYILPVTWLPAAQEADALARITGCSKTLANLVVDVLTLCRAKAATGDLVDAPSIRSAIAWIEAMPALGIRAAWDIAVAARQPAESAVQLEALYTSQVNEQVLAQAL